MIRAVIADLGRRLQLPGFHQNAPTLHDFVTNVITSAVEMGRQAPSPFKGEG